MSTGCPFGEPVDPRFRKNDLASPIRWSCQLWSPEWSTLIDIHSNSNVSLVMSAQCWKDWLQQQTFEGWDSHGSYHTRCSVVNCGSIDAVVPIGRVQTVESAGYSCLARRIRWYYPRGMSENLDANSCILLWHMKENVIKLKVFAEYWDGVSWRVNHYIDEHTYRCFSHWTNWGIDKELRKINENHSQEIQVDLVENYFIAYPMDFTEREG